MSTSIFNFYRKNKFILSSGHFEPTCNDGKIDKNFKHHTRSWKSDPKFDEHLQGHALLTGKTSGITAIDIDDPTLEHNKELISFCEKYCNLIQRTKKGYHFLFKYTDKLTTATNEKYKIDIRNDNALLYIEPSNYSINGFNYKYEFIKKPNIDESINEINDEIIQFIYKLYGIDDDKKLKLKEHNKNVKNELKLSEIKLDINQDELLHILNNISKDRFKDYDDWKRCGIIFKNHNLPVELFEQYSSNCEYNKYKEGVPTMFYNSIKSNQYDISIKTLYYWLKIDNPSEFKLLHDKYINEKKDEKKKLINADYITIKNELNNKLFMINSPIQYGYINDLNETVFYNLNDLKQRLKPYQINNKDFIDFWLKDINKNSYEKIDFMPLENNPKIYNVFKGFKYDNDDEINMEKIQPFLDLINNLLDHEQISVKALLDWVSWIRQKPNQKSNKAVVLYSEYQGVGKNTLVELFRKVIGYDVKKENVGDLVGRFNYDIAHKLMIYVDEVKLMPSISNDIKNMITRTRIDIEKKGQDGYNINDYANYIYTTNDQKSFHIEPSDRRFYAFNCKNIVMTPEQSTKLYALLNDDEMLKSFDSYIKNRPLPDRLPNLDNKYKQYLISMSLPAYITMIYRNYIDYANKSYRVSQLYADALIFAKDNGYYDGFSAKKMSYDFAKEFKEFIEIKDNVNHYVFPKTNILLEKLKIIRSELIVD